LGFRFTLARLNSRPILTHLVSAGVTHPVSADLTHPVSAGVTQGGRL
jgi:hypothetical protein